MTLNTDTFTRAMETSAHLGALWFPHAEAAMMEYGIMSHKRAAMFLAQIGHESNGLRTLVESLNYSTKALLTQFGRHRISEADCYRYGRNELHAADQYTLANLLYGGEWGRENLGNTEPDDGWTFRGQGPKNLTGRANVTAARNRMRVRLGPRVPDFVESPHLLCAPEWGMYAAADFWHHNGLNAIADTGNCDKATKRINGGMNGADDRRERYALALEVLA